ncbi:hypothetical protein [Chromobacterium sp. IIBBL 290-4]|uniref:hypothetical protein n=1 Tax=Chromobacterium sp. IIBBL 290-4 TaxID=2953890 RepID=UPI0020B8EA69|nr:hypothetical protein [Chromobacterium sp. IIBBL 290-4]UTH74815.1 hypothetical protein NKT35_01525 [Chromobacterium sp. IIBBL 290-4]
MKVQWLAASLLAMSAWTQAESEPAAASAPAAEILPASETLGVRQPESVPYREALSWLDEFDQHHGLAPQASLQFQLRPPKGQTLPEDLVLKIVGESKVEALPVSRDGRVTLPRIAELAQDEDAVVRSNQKQGSYRWRPIVRTPGLADNVQRLGDLRLICRVYWPMMKQELSWAARASMSVVGNMCTMQAMALVFPSARKIESIQLQAGGRQAPLTRIQNGGHGFIAPLADESWPDDTLLMFRYAGG